MAYLSARLCGSITPKSQHVEATWCLPHNKKHSVHTAVKRGWATDTHYHPGTPWKRGVKPATKHHVSQLWWRKMCRLGVVAHACPPSTWGLKQKDPNLRQAVAMWTLTQANKQNIQKRWSYRLKVHQWFSRLVRGGGRWISGIRKAF